MLVHPTVLPPPLRLPRPRPPRTPAPPHWCVYVYVYACAPDCTHGHNPPQIKEAMATFDADGDGVTRQLAL